MYIVILKLCIILTSKGQGTHYQPPVERMLKGETVRLTRHKCAYITNIIIW